MSEGGWFDPEAIESERHDADCEMAELESAGRRYAALARKGICSHLGGCTFNGWNDRLYPELKGMQVGQFRCGKCGLVFASDAAMGNHRAVPVEIPKHLRAAADLFTGPEPIPAPTQHTEPATQLDAFRATQERLEL